MDLSARKAELEGQIAELSQTYQEAQLLMQQTAERIIFLQGQVMILAELLAEKSLDAEVLKP